MYRQLIQRLEVRRELELELNRRGLDVERAIAFGFRSVPRTKAATAGIMAVLRGLEGVEALRQTGLYDSSGIPNAANTDGFVIPARDENGRITGILYRLYHHEPKYLLPRGTRLQSVYLVAGEPGPERSLVLVEGPLKAYAASEQGGIWAFGVNGHALQHGHLETIARLEPFEVLLALDEDANARTLKARERWTRRLHGEGFVVRRLTWEGLELGGPKGIDDAYQCGALVRVRRLTRAMPELQPPRPRRVGSAHA